ncbi:MAG: hypothetical protein KC621_06760 [Myxococcales bacterium]|nr:hypothetical protein [Myxococcales bacterium]
MGIFDRIKQSVKGTAEGVVRGIEERNPDAVYEAAIDGQIASVGDLKDRVARLMVERDREADAIAALEREEVQLADGLRGALDEDDDETALVLQVRREEVADELTTRRATLELLAGQVREGQAGIVAAKEGTEGLKREKDVMLAQRAAADAALQIQDAVSGVGADPTSRALASVREAVGVLESRAHAGYLDEEGNSVRGRAEAMSRKATEQSARDQLAALKRQLGKTDEDD